MVFRGVWETSVLPSTPALSSRRSRMVRFPAGRAQTECTVVFRCLSSFVLLLASALPAQSNAQVAPQPQPEHTAAPPGPVLLKRPSPKQPATAAAVTPAGH